MHLIVETWFWILDIVNFDKWTIKIINDVDIWKSLMPHKINIDIINGANEV
jgi:hypothetical protein